MDSAGAHDLAKYRIESAEERLTAALVLINSGLFQDAVSRSYYAVFQATRAVLATKMLDSRKHSGIISLFNQYFIKTGLLHKDYGKILKSSKDYRHASDYNDFYIISKIEAKEIVNNALIFVNGMKDYLTLVE